MTIKGIIDEVLKYHPDLGDMKTCDVIIGGNPDVECKGILVTIVPTVDIIMKAIEIGANFILVHEPTYYSGYDLDTEWLRGNAVYEEKKQLLIDYNIVIFRDHDHMHAHRPDSIFHYVTKQLGWEAYTLDSESQVIGYKLPEMTFDDLLDHVKKAMDVKKLRYIGDPNMTVSTVGFVGHLLPSDKTNWGNNKEVAASWQFDVVIPGEIVEWTLPLYIKDAVSLNKSKGLILPGHFIQEEAGIKWAVKWLKPIIGDSIPMTFVQSGELFDYR